MRIHDAILVGCGGTGGYLAEPLARLLAYHPNASGRLTLVDGDAYEASNSSRQVFPLAALGLNKATVTAERLNVAVPWSRESFQTIPTYLNPLGAQGLVVNHRPRQHSARKETGARPVLLLVAAVDNHATRNSLIRALDGAGDLDFLFLSPGNALDRGQVVTWGKIAGQGTGPHPFDRHPELKTPEDRMPGGCSQEAPSTPQLIGANMGAATLALWTVQSWLDGRPIFDAVAFDTRRMESAGIGQPVTLDGAPLETHGTP